VVRKKGEGLEQQSRDKERNLVEGCYYTPGVKNHTYSTILFASAIGERNPIDKLPFWKPTTLGATATQTRKLHKSIPTPRNMPDSPNVELGTLPKPINLEFSLWLLMDMPCQLARCTGWPGH
jgi:hypothetical protein